MHILTNDPNAPQVNVWLTNTEMIADVSPSRLVGNLTMVNSTVAATVPDTAQSINISWPLTRDDAVAVDALAFTPERRGNFTINVTKSQQRIGGAEVFNRSDGTEAAGFLKIDHSISNDDVRNVSITFRVNKTVLDDTNNGPEDIALYRYADGAWRELPTRLVNENPTHYFFVASSPGLSDFTVGVKHAKFHITDAVVTVTTIGVGETTEVLVRVTNVGGADGTYAVRLLAGSTVVDRTELSIAPNGTRQASFEPSFTETGTYRLFVNDRFIANVSVGGLVDTTTNPSATSTTAAGRTAVDGPGFTAGLALLVLTGLVGIQLTRYLDLR